MNELGGYFGLEINKGDSKFHDTTFKFSSGRASLMFIIQAVKPAKVYVSFYTCDALLEPLHLYKIPYSFYSINQDLEIVDPPKLLDRELIIYINYFDVKRKYVAQLSEKYAEKLVVDCSQAFFLKGNNRSWYFNSSRKSFGVPDGSDLYVPEEFNLSHVYNKLTYNNHFFTGHLIDRYIGRTEEGYKIFNQNESISGNGLSKMSLLTTNLLSNIHYEKVTTIRNENFRYIHQLLCIKNKIIIDDAQDALPAFYPYLPEVFIDKSVFWTNKIFVPTFWNDCIARANNEKYGQETHFSKFIIPIPTDQRYSFTDFDPVLKILSK